MANQNQNKLPKYIKASKDYREWGQLILQAKQLGLTTAEIRKFLKSVQKERTVI